MTIKDVPLSAAVSDGVPHLARALSDAVNLLMPFAQARQHICQCRPRAVVASAHSPTRDQSGQTHAAASAAQAVETTA